MNMVQTFKIVNGIDNVNSQDWFTKAVNRGTGVRQDLTTWSSQDQSMNTGDTFTARE